MQARQSGGGRTHRYCRDPRLERLSGIEPVSLLWPMNLQHAHHGRTARTHHHARQAPEVQVTGTEGELWPVRICVCDRIYIYLRLFRQGSDSAGALCWVQAIAGDLSGQEAQARQSSTRPLQTGQVLCSALLALATRQMGVELMQVHAHRTPG